jgi:hypothetical protein
MTGRLYPPKNRQPIARDAELFLLLKEESQIARSLIEHAAQHTMGLTIYTLIHVLISLGGIATGFVVLGGWLGGKHHPRWAAWFLATTATTSVTGFFFPFKGFTPAYAFAVLSLLLLAVALYALYARRLAGPWHKAYVICAIASLYLNFFVLLAQLFLRLPALKELAPNGTEPPFGITQAIILVFFVCLGVASVRRFRETPAITAEE